MPNNNKTGSPTAYGDVVTVLDLALEKPGLVYRLKTYGAAINFRQRCNRYIKLLREQQTEMSFGIPGFRPEVSYDTLNIRQTDPQGNWDSKGRYLRFELRDLSGGDLIDPETGEIIALENLTQHIGEEPDD